MIYSAFKTYVLNDFKRTDKDTELLNAYNEAIVQVAVHMPHGSYKYQSYVSITQGVGAYSLPTNLIHLIHPVRLLDGSGTNDSGYQLDKISKQEYDEQEPNPNRTSPPTGSPAAYCIYARQILLTPIPNTTGELLEIDWSKRPTAVSGNSDLSGLGSEWDEVLKHMVLARLNAGIELYQEAQYWREQYQDPFGNPIGMYKTLLDIERDREFPAIGRIKVNDL